MRRILLLPIQALAIHWEILDIREQAHLLTKDEHLWVDIGILRRRVAYTRDAPPLNDAMRFPDPEVIASNLALNRAHRQHLEARKSIEFVYGWELHEAVEETEWLHAVWVLIGDARNPSYYTSSRRLSLQRVREMVGEEAYHSGRLPPYVPVWRFVQADR